MVLGIVVYVLYRRNQGLPLTETVKVLIPEPLGVEEIEYRSVLVAFEDDQPFSEEVVATAVKLASKRRRGIHVHSMLTVPTHLPLDAELPEQEGEAQSKIEQAKLIGGQRVTGHVERVRPGQAGYDIADEAKLINAAAAVVSACVTATVGPSTTRPSRPFWVSAPAASSSSPSRAQRGAELTPHYLESPRWPLPSGSTRAPSAPSPSSSSPSACCSSSPPSSTAAARFRSASCSASPSSLSARAGSG